MTEKTFKNFTKQEIQKATLEYFKGDDLATDVWIRKYCLKDENYYYELTPDDMHHRIAIELARIEAKYPNPRTENEIYETLKNFNRIIPQGSPMSGIGNIFQIISLGNCFVIGNTKISDSYGGIMKLDQEIVQLQKRRGGVGIDLSFIRPAGTPVKNSAITSTGVVPFMERFSNTTKEVAQDGRRGALMESISIKHPDAEKFIDAKLKQGKVTGANISIKIDDEFMRAVENDTYYIQAYPINISIDFDSGIRIDDMEYDKLYKGALGLYRKIKAKDLWKKIIFNAWKSAEPGILYWDTLKNESISSCYGNEWIERSTNPCFSGNEYLLTKNGYVKFKDLATNDFSKTNTIICDNRITYNDNGNEKPENWSIDINKTGVIERKASHVFLTHNNAKIVEIITSHGFKLKCTPDHHIATTDGMIEANQLTPNHEILIAVPDVNGSIINLKTQTIEEKIAILIGLITGDGAIDKNRKRVHIEFWGSDKIRMKILAVELIDELFEALGNRYNKFNRKLSKYFISENVDKDVIRISSSWLAIILEEYGFSYENKHDVPEFIMNFSSTNIGKYYVSALMYCDGSVQGSDKSGYTIRLSQSNLLLLEKVQKILHSNGMIFGIYKRRDDKMTLLPNNKGSNSLYKTKAQYELISLTGSFIKYRESIGFLNHFEKENKLNVAHNFKTKNSFYDKIIEINELNNEPVYCIKEDIGRNVIVNCISARRCGELPLPPYDSCRLLAINLYGYVSNPFTQNAEFNWQLFINDVIEAMRYMDDIIDLEIEKIDAILKKIESDPEDEFIKLYEINLWKSIRNKALKGRRTGLGVTAEGDMLAALGLRYGTDEATEFSENIHKTLKLNAYRSSVILAKERGVFPIYDFHKESDNPFLLRIQNEDPELYDDMIKYGRRNIALLTIAPTGTASIMTQTTSGIEPVFLPVYKRRRKINPQEKDARIDFVDNEGQAWQEYLVFHHKFEIWLEKNGYDINIVKSMNSLQIDEIVKQSPYYKATSNDVDWVKKVEMQGKLQKHVDHSISVTVNLPENITEEIVAKVYETGWRTGCKGITVYREGSRNGVLISETEKKDESFHEIHVPKRPKRLKAEIHRFQNNLEKWIAVVGLRDGRPYEIFTGKLENGLSNLPNHVKDCEVVKNIIENENENGEKFRTKRYDIEYIDSNGEKQIHTGLNHAFNPEYWNYAKLFSGVLRHGMPIISLYELIESMNLNSEHLNTWKNGVARVIKRYVKDGEKGKGKCPNCGNTENLQFKEGCLTCMSCGNSKCG